MSREIKFRQWDSTLRFFHHFGFIDGAFIGPVSVFPDENPVMQYTGLKDKNGVEIYEGDVCFCRSRMDSANMKVEFEDGKFLLRAVDMHSAYKDIRFLEKEVIGNVYENPELLEVSDD